jgi:Fur family transcriptional regulator, ferric uptake regulator
MPAPEWIHEHGDLKLDAAKIVHSRGGRMTSQRKIILDSFRLANEHPTAEDIFRLARKHDPSLNLSTVYRTLRWL